MSTPELISSPQHPALEDLCESLFDLSGNLDASWSWPAQQLKLCGRYGVFRWFLAAKYGGLNWNYQDVIQGYLALSEACLTTTFVLTQRTGACRRIASGSNEQLKADLLPALAEGTLMASVGISHLTTSRQHLQKPVLAAREDGDGFVLDGYCPWVTGGPHCDVIVIGASLEDGRQILAAVETATPGVKCEEPAGLMALSASHTGKVKLEGVRIDRSRVIDGPVESVLAHGTGGGSGGLETSALAIGLAAAAVTYLEREGRVREDLDRPAEALRIELAGVRDDLLLMAAGEDPCTKERLRTRANSLVLRATQASLTAAKGAGFMVGHPTGRWCREALFFLVWSCPQPVAHAALCELASLQS